MGQKSVKIRKERKEGHKKGKGQMGEVWRRER